ncbi:glycosyltransferase family 4 protein [Piscinibacter terrae]|uniref:Glycosyltransferase n=1 Tax=Piscinibacter terrae TaxID=2496871 RepID=A0A3N7HNW8_9BURK|nr:glycosyltransferase family 4 protein [Albitalea terrae]RQP23373.1 glycosyltransferase [Albitalea terrae]
MRILVIHQNFPGQFRHIAKAWSERPGWEVVGIGREGCPGLHGMRCITYKPHRDVRQQQHHYLSRMESAVLHGQAVARLLLDLKKQGFTPDAILAHPGWGETLYAKDVFPDARLIHFCEWFYSAQGADVGFDPEFPTTFDDHARIRTWNALHLLNLENCDVGVSPTQWQKSRHPQAYQDKIVVAHEGIDTELLGPDPNAQIVLNGRQFKAGEPIITYVARNLEPYRGFHVFMRALEKIQKEHKGCHTIIVGGDDVSYGRRPKDAKNWREKMLREVKVDPSRTHFVGKLPYDQYRKVLQVSAAHVYLTYPFVLSWSMLEAMASGCVVIGSKTAPVEEVLRDGVDGRLAGFHDVEAITAALGERWDAQAPSNDLCVTSRRKAQGFTRFRGLQSYDQLLLPKAGYEQARISFHDQLVSSTMESIS